MAARRGVVGVLVGALVLSGCSGTMPAELDNLRERFVTAGGSCASWSTVSTPGAVAARTCAEGAVLMVFGETTDRAEFIKSELETNPLIRDRTHIILSKDTWLVLDTLASIVRVMPALGGMISGRNGANP
jgi:hypothetical protein